MDSVTAQEAVGNTKKKKKIGRDTDGWPIAYGSDAITLWHFH